MNATPLVTIVIPLFNREDLIKESIDSVLQQTYSNIELIVIDDASKDNSFLYAKELSEQDPRIKVFSRPLDLPKGANSCRNYGLEISKGSFIKWLDSDDLIVSTAIEEQYKNLQEFGSDVSLCRSIRFSLKNNQEQLFTEWGNVQCEPSIQNYISSTFKWHTCAALWRKDYFEKQIPWDNELMNSQEWLFHLESMMKGVTISVVPEFLCKARVHQGSMSNDSNKKGNYYYHQCLSRYKAIIILDKYKYKKNSSYFYLFYKMMLFHVFTFYKGNISMGLKALSFYPRIILLLFQRCFK